MAAPPLPAHVASAQTPEPQTGGLYDLINHTGVSVSDQAVTFGDTYFPDLAPEVAVRAIKGMLIAPGSQGLSGVQ